METVHVQKDSLSTPLQACTAALTEVDAARRGDFDLSITEPSPGEPAISMLTSAMEILQLLFDASEW